MTRRRRRANLLRPHARPETLSHGRRAHLLRQHARPKSGVHAVVRKKEWRSVPPGGAVRAQLDAAVQPLQARRDMYGGTCMYGAACMPGHARQGMYGGSYTAGHVRRGMRVYSGACGGAPSRLRA